MTRYRVFRATAAEPYAWEQVGTVDAHSARQAIRQLASNFVGTDGELNGSLFAATPDSSWAQLTVTVKTETRVKVG